MRLNFIFDYLKHQLTANTRHGTHSPFVYNLADKVVYNTSENLIYKELEKYRSVLLKDDREITITDLGAGSLINDNKRKKVKQIAKNALKKPELAQLLFRIAADLKPASIIELGTCLGITTAYFAKSNAGVEVKTVEGCPNTASIANEGFEILKLKNIALEVGNFDDIFPKIIQGMDRIDLVYIDGNHRKDATLQYFNLCLEKADENTLLIFDDIYWSTGMKEAWALIKAHPKVTVTVDLFWIGLVYFKKGQVKQDFKLKI